MKKASITSVNVDTDTNTIKVTALADVGQEHKDIPLRSPGSGFYYVPKEGEQVVIYDEGDGMMAALAPRSLSDASPPLPDLKDGEYSIVVNEDVSITVDNEGVSVDAAGETSLTVKNDGTIQADGSSIVLGDGGNFLLTDVTVDTTTDADGHVTSVSLNKTRSTTTETE